MFSRHLKASDIKAERLFYETKDMSVTRSPQVQNGLSAHKLRNWTGGGFQLSTSTGGIFTCAWQGEDSACRDAVQLWTLLLESCHPLTVNHRARGGHWKSWKSLSWYFQLNISFLDTICLAEYEWGTGQLYLLVFGKGSCAWLIFQTLLWMVCDIHYI